MMLLSYIKNFIYEQSKNYKILLVRSVFDQFFTQLSENFNNLYIVVLGATPLQLSTVKAVGSAISAFIAIPAGVLSDIYSIKKIMVFGMGIQVLSVAFYAFAKDWTWIIIAVVLGTLTWNLVFRTEDIIIANSLSDYNRARGYGIARAIVRFFSLFSPAIGGILVYFFGGISIDGIRPLYYIQLIGFSIISIYVIINMKDIEPETRFEIRGVIRKYGEMLGSGTYLKRFIILDALGAVTWWMSIPFPYIYAVNFKGANSLTIGNMGTCLFLVSMFLAIPMGSIADQWGRKLTIYITRPFFWASYLLLVLAPKGMSWLLLLAWGIRGVMMSSRAWDTMSIEMVPKEFRGRWTGFKSLFQSLISVPALLLGGYIYQNVDPKLVFIISILVDSLIRIPIISSVPETLKKSAI